MSDQMNRYFDYSEDEALLAEFDPDDVSDIILQIHGAQIRKHMQRRNPTTSIKGLLGYQILITQTTSDRIERAMSRTALLLGANAALVGYIAYLLS